MKQGFLLKFRSKVIYLGKYESCSSKKINTYFIINFQCLQHGSSGIPLAAMQQGGIRPSPSQWSRNKSISEANLLTANYERSYHRGEHHHHLRDPRRNSVAEFGHHHDVVDHR